jgi:glycosyltransferase 2 family protein
MPKITSLPQVWIKRFQAAFVLIVVFSILFAIGRSWPEFQKIDWHIDPKYLIISIIITTITVLIWAMIWSWLLKRLTRTTNNLHQGASIYLYGNVAKYVPGIIWQYLARGYLGYKRGIQPLRIWLVSIIEIVISICTGLIIYFFSLLFPHHNRPYLPVVLLLLGLALMLGAISPPIYLLIQNRIRARHPLEEDNSPIKYGWSDFFVFLFLSILIWIIVGGAFGLFVSGIYPLPPEFIPELIGVWSLSISLGILLIFIPQGIGIREGLLILALKDIVPLPIAITISVSSRLWIIACELLATALWWVSTSLISRILPKHY